ncbi:MAG: dephospho-CoA kinase [Gemmatimonadota bacterium]|nr:dephospho-CoA kinase [Gemmatimonadota bacterium]
MLVAGLTGSAAAGKSAVAELWRRGGVPVASADELAREAVEPGTEALVRIADIFGPEVMRADGTLDRAAVRRIVFRDDGARRRLEALVHPEVRRLLDEWTGRRRDAGAQLVVWEVPLLFETGMEDEVDAVVVVDAPRNVRRRRLVETRGLGGEEADAVMAAQLPAAEKRRKADLVVDNGGTRGELAERAAEALRLLRARGS